MDELFLKVAGRIGGVRRSDQAVPICPVACRDELPLLQLPA
ncbi:MULTISPECIES: hypothetical protein [unclassified Rhizobium]|nr:MULTISPECIES: hypothetical protein [unclassified Rhizobium]